MQFCLFSKAWKQLANFAGGDRNSCIAFSINGKGYLGLGQNPSSTKLYDFYEYDPSSNTWTKKSNYPGGGSFASSAFVINGRGYVCFGANGSGAGQKDLWEYNPNTDTWTQKATFPGSARYGTSWFVIKDTAFLMTGSAGGAPYLSDVWMYVPATNTWTQKSNFPGGSRVHGAGFTINGVGYFGTGISNSTTANKDIWRYNKSTDTWTKVADVPTNNFTGAIAFEIDKKGYIGTGYTLTSYLKDVYRYDVAANTWSKVDSIPSTQSARGGSVSFVINSTVYYGTGYSPAGGSLTDLWSYTTKSNCGATFVLQPQSQTIAVDNTVVFKVQTTDTTATLKWQINTGSGYVDISNSGQFSGATTKQLTVSGVKYLTNHNNKFRCIAAFNGCADTSFTAILSVSCKDLITLEPVSFTGNNGDKANFQVSTAKSGTLFQWQVNDGTVYKDLNSVSPYSGHNKDTLKISDLLYNYNNYKYRAIVKYSGCNDTSTAVTLTVNCTAIINLPPVSSTVYSGNTAKFGLKVYSNGTSFQWQLRSGSTFITLSDAGIYNGVKTDTLIISPVNIAYSNQKYRCLLNYKGCKDTTDEVLLNVLCNQLVNKQPINQTKTEGEVVSFNVSSFESASTYLWQGNTGLGFQNLNNFGQFSGVSTDTLKVSNLLLSNNNLKVRCIVSYDGCSDTSNPATLNVICKPLFLSQPNSVTGKVGQNALLTLSAATSKVVLSWQTDIGFGFQKISNAGQYTGVSNDSLIVSNLSLSNNNQGFRCIANLGGCWDTTKIVKVFVTCQTLLQNQPSNQTGTLAGSVFFTVGSKESGVTYKWQSDVGFGFQNLSNAGQYKGVNNDTLTIINLTQANDNQAFRCLLSTGPCSDTTNIVNLTIKLGAINTISNNDKLVIYPNPSNQFITIKAENPSLFNSFKIIDQQGRVLLNEPLLNGIKTISIENLKTGLYFIETEPTVVRKLLFKN